MRNGYIKDNLTSVDIQEIFKIGRKVKEYYEGAIYRDNFMISPFRKAIDKLFSLRQKFNDENNNVMQFLVRILLNNLYLETIRQDIEENFACKSEYWMMTENDEKTEDYWKMG